MILEACSLIDLLTDDTAAVAKLDEIQDRLLIIPTLTYTEVGVGIDPASQEGQCFEEIMDRVMLVPYDGDAARRAVDVQRQLCTQGTQIGAVDGMIAGIALVRDAPIVTRNVEEFSRTPARVSPY